VRLAAEQRVAAVLRGHPIRRVVFRWVLAHARERVRERENLRFERTRVFGRVRRIFVELGRRFAALDLLDGPRDVFYLEVEEVLGYVTGTVTTTDLRGLVAVRTAEYARYRAEEPPAERFATRGIVYHGNAFAAEHAPAADTEGDRRTGIGCCAGVVRGRVRVVTDPKTAEVRDGDILVAERTDPGWIMLFPSAAGVLVERGSLLSHSAIVAREMGIPTIVSVSGVTRWLRDGDEVEMDGSAGTVVKLALAPAPSAVTQEAVHG
jgi:pyruvate,water dikinase